MTATAIQERSLQFATAMVLPVLDGRKTQTRRIAKMPRRKTSDGEPWLWFPDRARVDRGIPTNDKHEVLPIEEWKSAPASSHRNWYLKVPNAHPGDYRAHGESAVCTDRVYPEWEAGDRFRIAEPVRVSLIEFDSYMLKWDAGGMDVRQGTPELMQRIRNYKNPYLRGVNLPAEFSRDARFEVTAVRAERVNEISEDDAKDEFIPFSLMGSTYRVGFENLWNSIYGCNAFDTNPFVWAITFKRITSQ